MKAMKDVEVGDFYFKRKTIVPPSNATKKLSTTKTTTPCKSKTAQCQEKLGNKSEAKKYYEQYLKILPEGESRKKPTNHWADSRSPL